MGLFSRKKSEQTTRSTSRTATSSEAQAAELRGRARRRLVGALVLVLTAIIIVPMMFDDTSTQEGDTPVVLPAIVPPIPEPDLAVVTPQGYSVDEPVLSQGTIEAPDGLGPDSGAAVTESETSAPMEPDPEQSPTPSEVATAVTESKPETEARTEPAPAETKPAPSKPVQTKPEPDDSRTDDGSVALALLEGRVPSSAAQSSAPAAKQGAFVLQVAAYSTEADAQTRRSSLINAGVTNAYVERAVLNDKPTYRLRVGSFPTRDAAQAAQARLRALGYDNSLLLTQ